MEYQVDNHDTDEDFALSAGPGYSAAMCSKCGQIRPIAEFKRTLSRAQSKARGYAGNVPLEIESSLCGDCQPNSRSIAELSAKEIRNRMASGDLNALTATKAIKKRKQKAKNTSRVALQRAWDNAKTAPWAKPISEAQAELTRLRQQEKYVKNHLTRNTVEIDLTFFVEYKLLLSATVARMKFEKMRTCKEPPFSDWRGFIDEAEYAKLFTLWEAMPMDYRKRVKPPSLFSVLPGDAREGSEVVPVRTLSTMPSAAARLAQGKKDRERREARGYVAAPQPDAEGTVTSSPEHKPTTKVDWEGLL